MFLGLSQKKYKEPHSFYLGATSTTHAALLDFVTRTGNRLVSPDNKRHLYTGLHLNPLLAQYIVDDSATTGLFPIDEQIVRDRLTFLAQTRLPILLTMFSGKFFSSAASSYLQTFPNALMWNRFDEPVGIDVDDVPGGLYFSFAEEGPVNNRFLDTYERNIRTIASLVAEKMEEDPLFARRLIGISVAGEMKYTTASGSGPTHDQRGWSDYNPNAVQRFKDYIGDTKIGAGNPYANVAAYVSARGLPVGWTSTADLDPPRGTRGGAWDVMPDASNDWATTAYFNDWFDYRVWEIKQHILACKGWIEDEGIKASYITRFYSHQAIIDDTDPFTYLTRGTPEETLNLAQINQGRSLYHENAQRSNEASLDAMGARAISLGHKGGWYTGQWNPGGDVEITSANYTDPAAIDGYSVANYLDWIHMLEESGCRAAKPEGDYPEVMDPDNSLIDLMIRTNFQAAWVSFMAGN